MFGTTLSGDMGPCKRMESSHSSCGHRHF